MENLENLQKQLKEIAMGMSQDEYLTFVHKPLMEANGDKMRGDIEKIKIENHDVVKAIEEEMQKELDYLKQCHNKRIDRLRAENARLEKELKEKGFDKITLPKPTKTYKHYSYHCGINEKKR